MLLYRVSKNLDFITSVGISQGFEYNFLSTNLGIKLSKNFSLILGGSAYQINDDKWVPVGLDGNEPSNREFGMNFGINLLAQPGGNLVGAIGKAGQQPLQQFQAARRADKASRRKEQLDEFETIGDRATDIFKAEEETRREQNIREDQHTRDQYRREL